MGQLRDKPAFHASPTPLTLHALFSCSRKEKAGTRNSSLSSAVRRRETLSGRAPVLLGCQGVAKSKIARATGGSLLRRAWPGSQARPSHTNRFLRTMVPAGGPLHRGADEVVRRSKRRRRRLARRCAAAVAHAGGNRLRSTKRISHAQRPISYSEVFRLRADDGLRAARTDVGRLGRTRRKPRRASTVPAIEMAEIFCCEALRSAERLYSGRIAHQIAFSSARSDARGGGSADGVRKADREPAIPAGEAMLQRRGRGRLNPLNCGDSRHIHL